MQDLAPTPSFVNSDEVGRGLDFLEALANDGAVAICVRLPEGAPNGVVLRFPADRDRLRASIVKHGPTKNFHFVANEPKDEEDWTSKPAKGGPSKPTKRDILRLRAVVVDVDPQGGTEDFAAERERLLALAETWRTRPAISPSAIIDLGGGIQLVWFLVEPLDATEENVAAVELQNKALAKTLGGDATQSVEHLFRIPGTWNVPNTRKLARGRTVCLARLLHLDASARYALGDLGLFTPSALSEKAPVALPSLDDFDYAAVIDAAFGGLEYLPPHLREIADRDAEASKRILENNADDRSDGDFALLARHYEFRRNAPNGARLPVLRNLT